MLLLCLLNFAILLYGLALVQRNVGPKISQADAPVKLSWGHKFAITNSLKL